MSPPFVTPSNLKTKANAPECSSRKSTNQLLRNVARNLYRHDDNGAYYAERKINGKVIQRGLQTSDRAVANRKLRDWLADLDNRNPALEKATLEQLFETFRGTFAGKAKKTRQTNESIAKRFKESWTLGMDVRISAIKPSDLQKWFAQRESQVKPATFNRHGLFFSQLFQIAVSDQVITKSPMETVNTRKRIIREKPHIPTPEQFHTILADVRGQRFNAHAGHSADFIEFMG